MVQYFNLQEAAARLRVTTDQLKEMAKNGEIRAFQDRGNMRFRAQEIEELARLRGAGSDPDLPLGEAPTGGRSPTRVFSISAWASTTATKSRLARIRRGRDRRRRRGGRAPRLRAANRRRRRRASTATCGWCPREATSTFKSTCRTRAMRTRRGRVRGKKDGAKAEQPDSGVRIVPLDKASDSDVKMVPDDAINPGGSERPKSPSDSDVRLESGKAKAGDDDAHVTEEIDLDAEARKDDEIRKQAASAMRKKTGSATGSSPFELSDPKLPASGKTKGAKKTAAHNAEEFEVTAADAGKHGKPSDSHDAPILMAEDEVGLGEVSGSKGESGINLQDPKDGGISLEDAGSDEIEFELSLAEPEAEAEEVAEDTDSSSEFELSLDAAEPNDKDSSSEFELSLEGEESGGVDSSSEFELSLDVDDDSSIQLESSLGGDSDSEFELALDESGGLAAPDKENDIFETDIDVPALDEESGSEALALEEGGDLENSDFDMDVGGEGETGSQVVALEDEEDVDEGAETVARPRRAAAAIGDDEEVDGDLEGELEDEEQGVGRGARAPVYAPPANWGVAAPVGLLVWFVVLFVVVLMNYELVAGLWGFHKGTPVAGPVVSAIAKQVAGGDGN